MINHAIAFLTTAAFAGVMYSLLVHPGVLLIVLTAVLVLVAYVNIYQMVRDYRS